jgi:L-tyrosine isonitrile desaturase/decarboxylase
MIPIVKLRELLKEEQLLIFRGLPGFESSEEFSEFCRQLGDLSLWPFGTVLELKETEKPEDHIFDHRQVPLHWDGMFREVVPELQVFFCKDAPSETDGGRTTFSNTKLLLEKANQEEKLAWKSLTGFYRRKMEFYDSSVSSALLSTHPLHGFPVIRFGEPQKSEGIINPAEISFTGPYTFKVDGTVQSLRKALYSSEFFYAHTWQKGDVVIADNFSLLHGREAFLSKSPRHLQRVHVLSDPPFQNPDLETFR